MCAIRYNSWQNLFDELNTGKIAKNDFKAFFSILQPIRKLRLFSVMQEDYDVINMPYKSYIKKMMRLFLK